MAYLISSLPAAPSVVSIDDLGWSRATPFSLVDLEGFFSEAEIFASTSLKTLLLDGIISAQDQDGNSINEDTSSDKQTASQVPYDGTSAGLTETEVQSAIDKLKLLIDNIGGGSIPSVYTMNASSITITHNKGTNPPVWVTDNSGERLSGTKVRYLNPNQLQVILGISINGYVYIG